jgi:hypothetical protein
MTRFLFLLVLSTLLASCGGGGGNPGTCSGSQQYCAQSVSTSTSSSGSTSSSTYIEPPVQDATSVAQQCAAPRPAGTLDPFTQDVYQDVQGSLTAEKLWVRAMVNDTYLWYKDVVPLDPERFNIGLSAPYIEPSNNSARTITLMTNFDVVDTYFNSQRSLLTTASGKPKDQFHFTYKTSDWSALSTAGSSVGFGLNVELLSSRPPRVIVVSYPEPGSPATAQRLTRGVKFVTIDGVDVATGDPAVLNEALFSPVAGKQYSFSVLDVGSNVPRTVVMEAKGVTSTPVQNVRTLPAPYNGVGYMQFNDHIATAEAQLIAAVSQLKSANAGDGVSDLVLDLRYNGGGLLDIASELAYMIAGPSMTSGKTFERTSFNEKNPFGLTEAQATTGFLGVTQGFSTPRGQVLPQLGLSRVFIITGAGTCSASEAIINGLNGVGVRVILIGDTTCGKPYGFYPLDNCGVTFFAIQFKGVNQLGFGDYADGFMPGGSGGLANQLPGCKVGDDFSKPLGDPS